MRARPLLVVALLTVTTTALAQPIFDYVNMPNDSYGWKKIDETKLGPSVTLTNLKLISQVWRGTAWTHRLQIIRPTQMRYPRTALMLITGGLPSEQELSYLSMVSRVIAVPVVILGDVPNQPLYDGLREDALIAFTFNKLLESGETDWPLLFPMTKAAVWAMDVVEQYTRRTWQEPVESFCVSGGSKRGWTAWFTAVVAPKRIAGIAPMAYDNLNLPDLIDTGKGKELATIVDPYTYRARATMPKLIITETNDRYWPLDAANLYFADLPDRKYLVYVPNSGHDLEDIMRVINAQIGFFAMCTGKAFLPRLSLHRSCRKSCLACCVHLA